MAEAYYEPTPATDGATMNPVPGAVFQVFEIADTTFSTPLSLRVGSGNPTTTVTASETLATLPGVYVTSPNYEHIWKSGTFEWRRDSIDGAKKAIEDAKLAASNSASASDASAVSAANAAQAAQDAAALVDAPADQIMADTAANPASQFAGQLSATIAEGVEESPVVAAKQPKERSRNVTRRQYGGRMVRHNLTAGQAAWADPHITIFKSGKKYVHAFDVAAYKVTGGNTIWADAVNGLDTNAGTEGAPVKALWKAYELATEGGTIMLKDGNFYRNTAGWAAILLGQKSVNIMAQNPGKVKIGSFDTLTWALTSGQTRVYQATRTNTLRLVDLLAGPDGYEYKKLSSVAEVAVLPGSWYTDNTTVYVNTLDGKTPTNGRHLAILSTQALTVKADTAATALYIEGIDVIGGQDGNVLIDAVSQQVDFYAKNCRFLYPALTSMNSVSIQGARRAFFQGCTSHGGLKDGFNYTSWNTGTDRNRAALPGGSTQFAFPRFIEVDCHSYGHGLGTGTLAPTIAGVNNASTAHAGAKGIRIGGVYHDTDGAVVADVQTDTESDNYSCISYKSHAVDPLYNAAFSAQQAGAVMRVYDGQAFDTTHSVHAASGATMTVDSSEIETTFGGGTITVTDPQ